jgi:hypothetical protein
MQHARIKPYACQRTCNPVQRPDFRCRATKETPKGYQCQGLESPSGKTEFRSTFYLLPGWCCHRGSRARAAVRLVLLVWSRLTGWF